MKLKSITGKARPGAFTLIEVLLVIVIIMLLAGSIVAFIIPQQASAEKKTAKMLVNNVKGSLDNYRLNIGHYPTEEEGGLLALLKKPEFENEKLGTKWAGPYVKADTTFEDAWSNTLVYEPATRSSCKPAIPRTAFTPRGRMDWKKPMTTSVTRKFRKKWTAWRN